ncbi:MAG: hypothetical protein H8E45_01460 [Proteobacteria bacterium]|nr:hypothetical protein [Pseudomonadota bacterium]
MRRNQLVSCVVALLCVVFSVPVGVDQAGAQCTAIDGGKLKIKPAAGNSRSKLNWKAKDKSVDFLIADPASGTTAIEMAAAGTVLATLDYGLASASAWRSGGTPVRVWKYKARDDPSPIDGIEKIISKRDLFKLKGKQGLIDLLVAPLALPITLQITDSTGACYLARFSQCSDNNSKSVKCRADRSFLPDVPNLVFQSGFEDDTNHVYSTGTLAPCTDDLWGMDSSVPPPNHWENDLEGGLAGPFGQFHFCFGGGDRSQRSLNLVPDPDNPSNQVLYGRIGEPNEVVSDDAIACNNDALGARKSRIQAVVQDNPGLGRLDYRLRVRLGKPALDAIVNQPEPVTWFTLGEFWNNQPAEDDSFRITLGMDKAPGTGERFFFSLKAEKQDAGAGNWIGVWPSVGDGVSDVEVPHGKWFTLEVTMKEGDAGSGRAHVRMTDDIGQAHTIADVTNWTYSPDAPVGSQDGFKDFHPLKLYTSGQLVCALKAAGLPLEIWWDDLAIGSPN